MWASIKAAAKRLSFKEVVNLYRRGIPVMSAVKALDSSKAAQFDEDENVAI